MCFLPDRRKKTENRKQNTKYFRSLCIHAVVVILCGVQAFDLLLYSVF